MRHAYPRSLCWFRRDLRLHDHSALFHALKDSQSVYCVFVFDTDILDRLSDKTDRRVEFIWRSVGELHRELERLGSTLLVLHGSARQLIPQLAQQLDAEAVYCNRDYEPESISKDSIVSQQLEAHGVAFHSYKDQVIFERDEVLNGSGRPYAVFTPYKNAWLKKLEDYYLQPHPTEHYFSQLAGHTQTLLPSLESIGFRPTDLEELGVPWGMSGAGALFEDFQTRIDHYRQARDVPSVNGTSLLSVHLRFGTISVRTLARFAHHTSGTGAQTWLSELIWRDFYQMLLFQHPQVVHHAYKARFDDLVWGNDRDWFAAWCAGRTGYPLVDAAMRQLIRTGFMHNRLRMVTASFLVKDLQIDWRWGEARFADHLLDFDLASNNGGWQWAASTGCDAQPWFRIFNPVTQSEKFDPAGKFIRSHVAELANCPDRFIHAPWKLPPAAQEELGILIGRDYPAPIVDHALARVKTLDIFRRASG
jgi:deoxyribodipyrimidine photo-lyase